MAKQRQWRAARANDLRVGTPVRITFHDDGLVDPTPWVAIVVRKFRGWNANLKDAEGRSFSISRGFSDWGTYDIEVPV